MAFEQKPGTGSLWVNDRKTEDRHPDRTGTLVMPDGTEYFIDGWLKETKKGKKYLSLTVKLKGKKADKPATERPQRAPLERPGRAPAETPHRQQPTGRTRAPLNQKPATPGAADQGWPPEDEAHYEK